MALNDKILSEYFDDNNNITDTKRTELINKISDNLSNGSGKIITSLKNLLGFDDEFVKNNLPDFTGDESYKNGEIDLNDKEKFSQFHNEYIDKLFKSVLLPLNLPGQTPLLVLGIFDPTGLLPDFDNIKNQLLQAVPPELRNIQIKFPLTLIQLAILGGITDELISPIFSQLGFLNIKLVDIKNLDTNGLVQFLKNKVEIPNEFLSITDKEKYVKLIFGSLKTEEISNSINLDDLRNKVKNIFQDFVIKAFREKIIKFVSPEILLQTFPFPPPLPVPPVTLPITLLNTILKQVEELKTIVPIPEIPLEVLNNLILLRESITNNRDEINNKIKIISNTTPSIDEIITNPLFFKTANDVVPLFKIDQQEYINTIKNAVNDIINSKVGKYTELLKLPIVLIGQIFSKIDTILNFITDFSTSGISGILKNFFNIISGVIAPYFAEEGQTIRSLKDLSMFQAGVALTLITTLISTVLSVIIGSIFGKGQISKSILNFFG